jgi:MFS family permease
MMPYVKYKVNDTIVESKLNYEICRNYNYTELNRSHASWVSEFRDECNEIGTGLIGTFSFFGVLLGALVFQSIADVIGRRKSIAIASSGYLICMLAFQFASNTYQIWILCVVLQFFCSIGSLSSFLLMNEVIDVESRSLFGAIVQSSFSISGILFIAMFHFLDSWRKPFMISALICVITTILYLKFGYESPRYYLNLNKIDSFFNSLKKIATFNGFQKIFEKKVMNNYKIVFKELQTSQTENEEFIKKEIEIRSKDKEIIEILENLQKEHIRKNDCHKNSNPENHNFLSLLAYPSQRKIFLIMCYMWFCTSGVYYGLTINIKNLPGNTYITGVVMFIVESFAYFLSGIIINLPCLGRKKSISLFYSISFVIYSYVILFKPEQFVLISLSLITRFCVSGVYNIIYTYSTEVYPTVVRSSGLGMNSVFGRVGGMIFPLILEILQEKITFVFIALIGIALFLVMFLPETMGKPLTDMIPEVKSRITDRTINSRNSVKIVNTYI